ncbi:MAG TPA: tetratricopeptide repeat protein [Terriglobales bacterium]
MRSFLSIFIAALLGTFPLCAAQQSASPSASAGASASTAVSAFQTRLDALERAKQADDPEKVAEASKSVIALALRQMAGLRLLQSAFPEAAELYKRSLDFEELPDTHVDLAVVYMRAKQPENALDEASSAIFADSQNARAWHIQGKTWMMKKDYRRATESLARSISIEPDLDAAYALGISFLQLHEKEKAANIFAQMLDVAGDRAGLHVLFGRAYRDADLMDDAVREFKRAIAMDAKSSHAHYFLGLAYLIHNEWVPTPEARQEFLDEIQANPQDFSGNYFMGVITSGEKNYSASDAYLKIAAKARPDWPEPWLYLGLNAYGRGENDRAEQLLNKAVELTGSDEGRNNYQIRRAYYVLGRLLSAKGKKTESAAAIQRSREMEVKTLAESHQKIAAMGGSSAIPAQSIDNEEDETAKTALHTVKDPAAPLDPAVVERANMTDAEKQRAKIREQQLRSVLASALNDLGTSEARRQQYELALAHFHEAERWDGNMPGLVRNLGIAAFRLGKYPEAAGALRQVITDNSQDNMARSMLGVSLFMTQQYADAVHALGPIRDQIVGDPGIAYAYASSLIKVNELKDASSVLEALERQQLSPDTLLLIGQSWAEMGDNAHALSMFRKALAQNQSLTNAHYYSGIALIHLDQPQEAAKEFQAELALDPSNSEAQYHLAYALLQQSRTAEAKSILTNVVAAHPDHAEAQYQLGKILLDEGHAADAITHLETAARLSPEKDYVHYQLQAAYRKGSRPADAERELKIYREIKARNRERSAAQPASISETVQH